MPISSPTPENHPADLEQIYLFYAGLLANTNAASGLGGSLLYTGEPSDSSIQLLRAANIAGAASLAASADARLLRQTMRDGAIDFVVTSLDEALRILKNEIRKREPVAVGVSISPVLLQQEMIERGVLPNLLAPQPPSALPLKAFSARGAKTIHPNALPTGIRFLTVQIPAAWAERTAAFDAMLLDCLSGTDQLNRRWLHLSPRYLGAAARRFRLLACDTQTAASLMQKLTEPPPKSLVPGP